MKASDKPPPLIFSLEDLSQFPASSHKYSGRKLRVSMVCSLTCQYSILYGCNNTAHSSSGHALSLTLLLDTFIISSCLLAPPPSPLFLSYSAFLPLSLILSPHISSVCFLSQHLLFSSPSLPPHPLSSLYFMALLWPLGLLLPCRCAVATRFDPAPLWD